RSCGTAEPVLLAGVFELPVHAAKVKSRTRRRITAKRSSVATKFRTTSRSVRDRAFVHLVEQGRVLLLDDLALHLERRRELAVVDRQILRQDRELLHRLVLRELLVHL